MTKKSQKQYLMISLVVILLIMKVHAYDIVVCYNYVHTVGVQVDSRTNGMISTVYSPVIFIANFIVIM